jgi:hypothetical protein
MPRPPRRRGPSICLWPPQPAACAARPHALGATAPAARRCAPTRGARAHRHSAAWTDPPPTLQGERSAELSPPLHSPRLPLSCLAPPAPPPVASSTAISLVHSCGFFQGARGPRGARPAAARCARDPEPPRPLLRAAGRPGAPHAGLCFPALSRPPCDIAWPPASAPPAAGRPPLGPQRSPADEAPGPLPLTIRANPSCPAARPGSQPPGPWPRTTLDPMTPSAPRCPAAPPAAAATGRPAPRGGAAAALWPGAAAPPPPLRRRAAPYRRAPAPASCNATIAQGPASRARARAPALHSTPSPRQHLPRTLPPYAPRGGGGAVPPCWRAPALAPPTTLRLSIQFDSGNNQGNPPPGNTGSYTAVKPQTRISSRQP